MGQHGGPPASGTPMPRFADVFASAFSPHDVMTSEDTTLPISPPSPSMTEDRVPNKASTLHGGFSSDGCPSMSDLGCALSVAASTGSCAQLYQMEGRSEAIDACASTVIDDLTATAIETPGGASVEAGIPHPCESSDTGIRVATALVPNSPALATIELCSESMSCTLSPLMPTPRSVGGGTGSSSSSAGVARVPQGGTGGDAALGPVERSSRGHQPTGQPGPSHAVQGQGRLAALRRELAEARSLLTADSEALEGDAAGVVAGLQSVEALPDSDGYDGSPRDLSACRGTGAPGGGAAPEAALLQALEARCRQLERSLAAKDEQRRELESNLTGKVRGLEEHAARAARELERRERQVDELHLQGQALAQRLTEREHECLATSERAADLEREVTRLCSSFRGGGAVSSSTGATASLEISSSARVSSPSSLASGPAARGGECGGPRGTGTGPRVAGMGLPGSAPPVSSGPGGPGGAPTGQGGASASEVAAIVDLDGLVEGGSGVHERVGPARQRRGRGSNGAPPEQQRFEPREAALLDDTSANTFSNEATISSTAASQLRHHFTGSDGGSVSAWPGGPGGSGSSVGDRGRIGAPGHAAARAQHRRTAASENTASPPTMFVPQSVGGVAHGYSAVAAPRHILGGETGGAVQIVSRTPRGRQAQAG